MIWNTTKIFDSWQNVLVSDVDIHWNFYFNLAQLSQKHDSFHSYVTMYPEIISIIWGFTLCGCFIGYQANNNTIRFLGMLFCWCDDQFVLNTIFPFSYKMKWLKRSIFKIG